MMGSWLHQNSSCTFVVQVISVVVKALRAPPGVNRAQRTHLIFHHHVSRTVDINMELNDPRLVVFQNIWKLERHNSV